VKHLIGAVIALSLLGSTAAVAQRDNQDYQRNNQNYQSQPADPRQNSGGRYDPQGFNEPNNDRPHWSRGDRIPDQYRQGQYVVGDWRQHNLRTPPRGYHWVRNDNDQYLLAAIASGIIADIVSQNQYRDDYRWSQGERLSDGYRDNRYIVADWRGSHLRRPARGSHWVHVNDQYMLISGNGVIAQIVLDRR
jgi:Ni/Co efflux regulator RcnB